MPNGSLMMIMRNCINGDVCRGVGAVDDAASPGRPRLHRLAYSVSTDGVPSRHST